MKFVIGQNDVNKAIKLLYNVNSNEPLNFRELNKENTELYINEKRYIYKSYFIPEKEGIYDIDLKMNILLKTVIIYFVVLII